MFRFRFGRGFVTFSAKNAKFSFPLSFCFGRKSRERGNAAALRERERERANPLDREKEREREPGHWLERKRERESNAVGEREGERAGLTATKNLVVLVQDNRTV